MSIMNLSAYAQHKGVTVAAVKKAIESGRHYQLHSIVDEKDNRKMVGDILKCGELLI